MDSLSSFTVDTLTTSNRYVGAWESSCDQIHLPGVTVIRWKRLHIIMQWHIGPMLLEYLLTVGVDLHLPLALQPTTLKSQVDTPDTCKQ